jgi:hypothetical protein
VPESHLDKITVSKTKEQLNRTGGQYRLSLMISIASKRHFPGATTGTPFSVQ